MEKRLVGGDGALMYGKFGTDLTSGETLVAGEYYKIIAIDETASVIPVGITEGYMFRADGTETLATDDIVQLFDADKACDIQSWSMDFSKAEVDVTTLCDNSKTYRASKYDDITGNMEGIMTTGISDEPGGLLNQFATLVTQVGTAGSVTPKEGKEVFAMLMTDDTETAGEYTGFYFSPIVLTGFSASAGGDDAQSFSSPFRIASSDVGVVYYTVENS